MMAGYSSAIFNEEPEGFNNYFGDDDDDDSSDVEEDMDALAGSPPGSPDWKRLIASFARPASRDLQPVYQREREDPKHRMGDLLAMCFRAYVRKHPADPDGIHFYHWLDAMHDWDRLLLVSGEVEDDNDHVASTAHALMRGPNIKNRKNPDVIVTGNIKPSMVKAFMKGVAYMDKAGRKSHRVFFNGGTAFFKGGEAGMGALGGTVMVPLSTAEMSTVFSGKGFGIWVISEKGKLYVGNHVKGMLHHSSFLAGANVMCGGEMWARDGKIVFLTAKSGHYNPDITHLSWALRVLETCVDNFDHIKVMAWTSNTNKLLLISPRQIMFANNGLYTAWGPITGNEMARLRAGNFASFPDS